MTTKIDEARKETIAGFERMLSRGLPRGQAIDEALDAHYDRIESVCRDLDAELAAMDAILRQHQPPARPVPQTARSTSNRGGAPRPSPDDARPFESGERTHHRPRADPDRAVGGVGNDHRVDPDRRVEEELIDRPDFSEPGCIRAGSSRGADHSQSEQIWLA